MIHRLLIAGLMLLPSASGEDLHLGAYYYPWYDHERHWPEGYLEEEGDPALGNYNSRSPSVIRQHLEWSRQAGIDNWICSWWGPGSWEDDTLRRYVAPLIAGDDSPQPPTFCVFYESEGILGLDPDEGIVFNERTTAEFVEHFHYLAENYFDAPSYFRIDGRPVVFLYLSRTFSGEHRKAVALAREAARSLGHEVYLIGDEVYWGEADETRISNWDAVTAYNLHGPPLFEEQPDQTLFIEECDTLYSEWARICARLHVKLIPGFIPGFNSHGADPEKRHYPIARELTAGATSTSTLEALAEVAIRHADPTLNAVALTSFNEWHEDTQVEPREREDNTPDTRFLDALNGKFAD